MTTPAAFLSAICESPADDDPRLIMADWLDEHGQEARAEFIRVQVELERIDPAYHRADWQQVAHWEALRRRADELLGAHWMEWAPPPFAKGLPAVCRNLNPHATEAISTVTFHRGFVAEVTLSAEAWLGQRCPQPDEGEGACAFCGGSGWLTPGHADALVAATPLEVVRLTTSPEFTERGLEEPNEVWLQLRGYGGGVQMRCPYSHHEAVEALCCERWPRIRFELPAAEGGYIIPDEFAEGVQHLADGGNITAQHVIQFRTR